MLSLAMVKEAAEILKDVARVTPLYPSKGINKKADVYIKCENTQVTGSFKLRGAYYKISQLTEEEAKKGIIACSAGNHAQGVALAAQKRGISAIICMPEGAPLSKVEATESYGAEVMLCKGVYDDAYAKAVELKEANDYTFIHPFNDELVMAGQGTVGLEIMEKLPDADIVFVPVGGGGLISGIAYTIKQINPNCKIYGVQAEGAPSMYQSLREGKITKLSNVATMADGIAVKQPGDKTFEMVQNYVDGVVTVTEDEIATAILALIEDHKLVAEGAGAVSVAAAMYDKVAIAGKKVVCVISGGNIDVNMLSRIIDKALQKTGRLLSFKVEVEDKPGALTRLLGLIAESGANLFNVIHDRTEQEISVGKCLVDLVVETRNSSHSQKMLETLAENGYSTWS